MVVFLSTESENQLAAAKKKGTANFFVEKVRYLHIMSARNKIETI